MNDLVATHLPMVQALAVKMKQEFRGRVEHGDLVAFGTEGLFAAASRFDATRGFQFSTFAAWRVRGAMLDGARKLSGHTRKQGIHNLPIEDARQASLEDDAPAADELLDTERMSKRVRAALQHLPERERELMNQHYYEDKNLLEAGVELGIGKSGASRLHARGLARLRKLLNVVVASA